MGWATVGKYNNLRHKTVPMTLNKQLITVSLILLCLPWAGCQYLREMNHIMRSTQEQTLRASSDAIAAVFSQRIDLLYPNGPRYNKDNQLQNHVTELYFNPLPSSLWIDGYDEGWETIPSNFYPNPTNKQLGVNLRCGIYKQQLFMLFEVTDNNVVYNNPSKSLMDHGDRLILVSGTTSYSFTSSAPGEVSAFIKDGPLEGNRETGIKAYWQDTDKGYNVEVQLPVELISPQLGFYIIDQDKNNEIRYGQLSNPGQSAPQYIYQPGQLNQQLSIFQRAGQRLSILDINNSTLAENGSFQSLKTSDENWLIRKLYRLILNEQNIQYTAYGELDVKNNIISQSLQGLNSSTWYQDPSRPNQHILSVVSPIYQDDEVMGMLVSEQSSEQFTALSDSAFSHLLLLSFLAISLVAISLLGYASWLSWRIRRLSHAANNIANEKGMVLGEFPNSIAADEIGDLTRNYRQLLQRIGDYTEYLQTLSRKLSHELRTPLAIIHSSLDNLNNPQLESNRELYQQRAKQGALRLGKILTAMSEASRVEESIANAEPENFNIRTFLESVTLAYQDIYPKHQISLNINSDNEENSNTLFAMPDLIAQMLDKLIENAAGFCPEHGNIILGFSSSNQVIHLWIENDGPLLPEKMRSQLFDNMVSVRENNRLESHLGLGLHIVKLIVDCHNGIISARNREDNSGVIFSIELPLRKL
jgi:dedicated sortase system histidine kinase